MSIQALEVLKLTVQKKPQVFNFRMNHKITLHDFFTPFTFTKNLSKRENRLIVEKVKSDVLN